MSNWIFIPLVLLLLAGLAIFFAYWVNRPDVQTEMEKFTAALHETEAQIGKALLPPLEHAMKRMEAWLNRSR